MVAQVMDEEYAEMVTLEEALEEAEMVTLEEALEEAELQAVKTQTCSLDKVLAIAATDCRHPSVVAVWRDTAAITGQADVSTLVTEDSVDAPAVGHALVLAANGGYINCVRHLRQLMSKKHPGSILMSRFSAFAFLKACENGHQDVIRELLRPMPCASTAMMGYVIASRWKDKDPSAYPFVKMPPNIPGKDWLAKLDSTKHMLPAAAPISCAGGWDLRGMPGVLEELHDCIRAGYRIYLLWRAGLIAAANCHVEVFKVLLRQRALENTMLADSFHDTSGPRKSFDHDGKKIISERAKLDTLMYQLVEELSTKNYHDGILYTLWGHIQRGGRDSPRPDASRPRCVAQATNGLWEMQLEVPLLMMPVEHALQEEEPSRRYKHLTQLFSQRAKVNIQLTASVEALSNCLQIVVGIKHVRYKVENSRWDTECMGHFPSLVTLSVTPVTNEGTGVTMTNSSSNIVYKVGRMERIQVGGSVGDGASRGISAGMGASGAMGVTSTLKNKPWRFEQLPLKDERGGSFVWTLIAMKGVLFDRSNPMRMADRHSKWRWARRVPSNPLDQLPFTSEGGIIFTAAEFDDTMMWRFPKHMEGKKMRWSIEGQIHSTYTTTRYFETRMATFCGDIEEPLKPLEVKDKKGKGGDDDKPDKGEKGDKKEKGDKGEKVDKKEKGDKGDKKEKGEKEEKGDKKEKGDKGDKKEKGEKEEKDDKKEKGDKGNMEEHGDKKEKEKKEKGDKGDKKEKGEKEEKDDKKEKGDKGNMEEHGDKKEKEKKEKKEKTDVENETRRATSECSFFMDPEYLEFLEFKKFKERLRRQSLGGSVDHSTDKALEFRSDEKETEKVGFVVPASDILGNDIAIEIPQRPSTTGQRKPDHHFDDSEDVPIESEPLRDDDEAAQDPIAARIAAELETLSRSRTSEGVSRSTSMPMPMPMSTENSRPMSVRTRSAKSADPGR